MSDSRRKGHPQKQSLVYFLLLSLHYKPPTRNRSTISYSNILFTPNLVLGCFFFFLLFECFHKPDGRPKFYSTETGQIHVKFSKSAQQTVSKAALSVKEKSNKCIVSNPKQLMTFLLSSLEKPMLSARLQCLKQLRTARKH